MEYQVGDSVVLPDDSRGSIVKISFNKKLAQVDCEVWGGIETKWVRIAALQKEQVVENAV